MTLQFPILRFMVIAMHKLQKSYKIVGKNMTPHKYLKSPTSSKYHLLIGKNEFMVIAMHKYFLQNCIVAA